MFGRQFNCFPNDHNPRADGLQKGVTCGMAIVTTRCSCEPALDRLLLKTWMDSALPLGRSALDRWMRTWQGWE
jgi:hypothetical protein